MPSANLLDVDPSQLESTLRIVTNSQNDEFNAMLNGEDMAAVQAEIEASRASRVITPVPGSCIKFFTMIDKKKFFINLCQSDLIPAPEDITREQLCQQIQLTSPETAYRVPMSLSPPRFVDLKGSPVQCCDVAVHPDFFTKSQADELFGDFLIQVMIEAIDAKYGISLDGGKSAVLRNRKHLGTLVQHRVQNRDVEEVHNVHRQNASARERAANGVSNALIQELPETPISPVSKAVGAIEHRHLAENSRVVLDRDEHILRAEFNLRSRNGEPEITDSGEILLDIGSDRLRVQVVRLGILLDGSLQQKINVESVQTEWMPEKSILLIKAGVQIC